MTRQAGAAAISAVLAVGIVSARGAFVSDLSTEDRRCADVHGGEPGPTIVVTNLIRTIRPPPCLTR
jgi:hypothetical protein